VHILAEANKYFFCFHTSEYKHDYKDNNLVGCYARSGKICVTNTCGTTTLIERPTDIQYPDVTQPSAIHPAIFWLLLQAVFIILFSLPLTATLPY